MTRLSAQRFSPRRRLGTSVLVLGLTAGLVACGGDDSASSDLSREDLLAILEAAQVDRALAESLTDEQLTEAIDQIFAELDNLPAPETVAPESPDVTAGGEPAAPAEPAGTPEASVAPEATSAPDETAAPEAEEESGMTGPGVVITLPGLTIPIGNIGQLASTLGVKDLSVTEQTKFNRINITATEFGFGSTDLEGVDVTVNTSGVTKNYSARRSSNTSTTESVWFIEVSPWTETARVTVTVRDSRGESAGRSYILNP